MRLRTRTERAVTAEDVTKQLVDAGARIRAKQALAARLTAIIGGGKGSTAVYGGSGNFTITNPSTGVYVITFPGGSDLNTVDFDLAVMTASLYGVTPGVITVSGGVGTITIRTFNMAGSLVADRYFTFAAFVQ